MSSPYVKLGNKSVDQWKVTELKEELKRRRLTTTGLKLDLVRRLDEAVRIEMQSLEDEENESTQSEVPVENEIADTNISERTEDVTNREIDIVEKVDPKSGHEVNVRRDSSSEDKVIGSDLVQGTKSAGLEGEQVPEPSVVETTEVDKTAEPASTSSESNLQDHGTIEARDATILLNDDGQLQEDAKLELSDPITESPQINESSIPVVPPNGQNLQGSETQSDAIHPTNQRDNDDPSFLQPDPSGQTLKLQVSEVDPSLGFQVTSASVSTESVSIIEKNELKIDVINDNVKLELDAKPETEQSASGAFPDGGESHLMDVEEPLIKNDSKYPHGKKDDEEPLDKNDSKDHLDNKNVEEPHDEEPHIEATGGSNVENVDSLKSIDSGDMGPPEKLCLDRSSGDDSMEEDVTESKQMDDKADSFTENVEKSGTPNAKEEDHVDVVGHDKPVEMKVQPDDMEITNVENETVSTLTSGKRKFQDKEAVGNNDAVKKVRRWNAEGLKSSEPQSGSITPKGSSEPSFKPTPGTNSLANAEVPKERVVPPSSRPPTNSLRIDRFLRPFTLKAVQELLGKSGTVTSFWMDHIKTHCYVSYSSVEEAVETRNAVYNLQWPPNGGRLLVVEFVDPEEVKSRAEAPLASPATPSASTTPTQPPYVAQPSPRQQLLKQQMPPLPPPPSLSNPPHVRERLHTPREQPLPARDRLNLPPPPPLPLPVPTAEKVDPPIVTLDDLFRKTKATPRIYYLPLSDEVVAARLKTQGKNVTQ